MSEPFMLSPSSLRPLERLWNKLGWPLALTNHDRFPLAQLEFCILAGTMEVGIAYTDRRTGELGMLTDNRLEFPSETLVASFLLLVGSIDELVVEVKEAEHDKTRRYDAWAQRRGKSNYRR